MITIAIDGPAASGKGTLARRIAREFGWHYLDTGLLYRAVARDVMNGGKDLHDEAAAEAAALTINANTLADPALRDPGVGEAASVVARFPKVRAALLTYQRDFAARPPGAVLDGRDIGTVVLPNATVKIFVIADEVVRARRRYEELRERGADTTFDAILEEIRRRDARDMNRTDAPLKPADDTLLLDTTDLDIDAAFKAAVGLIKRKIDQ